MSSREWVTGGLLLALAASVGAGLWATREPPPPPATEGGLASQAAATATASANTNASAAQGKGKADQPRRRRERVVDMRPLLDARRLGAQVTAVEEQEFARQAERLADHAVDLAFADAMRQATEKPPATPEIAALAVAKAQAQAVVDEDQRLIDRLTREVAQAGEARRAELADQLEVARAQRELHDDELQAAANDLERAGGDPAARVKRLRAAYDAAQKEPRPEAVAQPPGTGSGSLLARVRAWRWQRAKVDDLAAAARDAADRAQRVTRWRERLTERLRQEDQERQAAKQAAAQLATGKRNDAAAREERREAAQEAVAALKHFTDGQRRVTDLGRRIRDFQELSDIYGQWAAVVEGHARAALHRLLEGVAWVLFTALATFLAVLAIDRLMRQREEERDRRQTLRGVAQVAVRLVGLLVAVLLVLGAPAQLTTIIGLAGAGLTVAMKDFIVAFFGWFVLMRRNGIRVGDWVEIKGVGGEVVEIGLLHTVLLETGSFGDAGHPTGRRVSFVNSFAIEGHYFNFSTSGQWMWDDLTVVVPPGQDPYPVIDGVQHLVEGETTANARDAEQEWRSSRYKVQTFSMVPGLQVVPSANGIELHVRYVTRARDRHETRRRLYQAVVDLMHGKKRAGEAA